MVPRELSFGTYEDPRLFAGNFLAHFKVRAGGLFVVIKFADAFIFSNAADGGGVAVDHEQGSAVSIAYRQGRDF